jgi:hypothetical protein
MKEKRKKPPVLSILILFFLVLNLFIINSAFGAEISNRKVTVSDSRVNISNVTYTYQWTGSVNNLRCFKILFCTTAVGACNTPTGLSTTGASKGTWSGLTAVSWTLEDPLTNGTLKLTNAAGEIPLPLNVSLEFSGITNPSNQGTYFNRITTYSDAGCSTEVDSGRVIFLILDSGIGISASVSGGGPPVPPGGGGGGGGGGPANVVFEGKAYPRAFITILKEGSVAATFFAENSGLFKRELTGLNSGTYSFGIFAEDTEKRKSVTIGFTVGLPAGLTTTISGIFISPTISLTPTQVEKGQNVDIYGQVFPESKVNIFISSENIVKGTNATKEGKWAYKFDTSPLAEAEHQAKSMALFGAGEQSPFSQTLSFLVLKKGAKVCKGADLNFDGKVNIVDFSILLYFWNQKNPSNRCADINFDGTVNIIDFSIMMYWWAP